MQRVTGAPVSVFGVVLLFFAFTVPVNTAAQIDGDTLRLETAVELARGANPAIRAAALRAEVSAQRIPQTGALPDPIFSFGLMNRNANGFGMGTAMAMNSVQLTQMLPWPGKLGFAREQVSHLAQVQRYESDESELGVVAGVKSVYAELAYMDRALEILKDTRRLLKDFLEVSSSLYAVGTGRQQDVLQAQVSVARTTEDITTMEHNRAATTARLNALLGRDVNTPIVALELPGLADSLPAVDSLLFLAGEFRPAFAAAAERSLAATASIRAAQRAMYPDLSITVGYGHRPDFPDVASVAVGVSLPIWAGSRQIPMRREMEAHRAFEDARAVDLHSETAARLSELRAAAHRARNLVALYSTSILPQARAAVETALSAYRVGTVDYMTLVESQLTVSRYSIEAVRLTADYHRAVANIEAQTGAVLGGES